MTAARLTPLLAACFVLASCVSFDPHYDTVQPDAAKSAAYDAVFANRADAKPGPLVNASKTLNDALAVPEARGAESEQVRHDRPGTLDLRFFAGSRLIAVRHFDGTSGMQEMPDHSLRINLRQDCGAQHPSQPVYACGNREVRVFVDGDGRLVLQESAQAAGVAGIVPYFVFVRDAVTFQHLADAPPPVKG